MIFILLNSQTLFRLGCITTQQNTPFLQLIKVPYFWSNFETFLIILFRFKRVLTSIYIKVLDQFGSCGPSKKHKTVTEYRNTVNFNVSKNA